MYEQFYGLPSRPLLTEPVERVTPKSEFLLKLEKRQKEIADIEMFVATRDAALKRAEHEEQNRRIFGVEPPQSDPQGPTPPSKVVRFRR